MRYMLYLFTLALVFTSGMLVGNLYIPDRNASMAVAVSVPELAEHPAWQSVTPQRAEQALQALTQALSACPVVVDAEKTNLSNQISLFLAQQDFQLKKAAYEAEIAKNISGNRTTAQFDHAAQEYTAAKAYAEQLAEQLYPQPKTENTPETAPSAPEENASENTSL